MTDAAPSAPVLSTAAVREWHSLVEAMMRGVAHSLNNRAAALSAILELSRDPSDDDDATRGILHTELARVRELAELVRLLGPPRRGAEAFAPDEVVQQAVGVLRFHADHDDRVTLVHAASPPPVRVERWMFLRAVIGLVAGARPATAGVVPVHLEADDDWLLVRIGDAAAPRAASPYVTELVAAMNGDMRGAAGFRVPTLAALRRREGR